MELQAVFDGGVDDVEIGAVAEAVIGHRRMRVGGFRGKQYGGAKQMR
jgi:hypothetical protein